MYFYQPEERRKGAADRRVERKNENFKGKNKAKQKQTTRTLITQRKHGDIVFRLSVEVLNKLNVIPIPVPSGSLLCVMPLSPLHWPTEHQQKYKVNGRKHKYFLETQFEFGGNILIAQVSCLSHVGSRYTTCQLLYAAIDSGTSTAAAPAPLSCPPPVMRPAFLSWCPGLLAVNSSFSP